MEEVLIREVGLRDGLQLVKKILPTEKKIEWLNMQAFLKFKEIEDMCEEYPGLKNVYEIFKHVYDLVRQDWVGKQKDVI